jgi:hypothetical protein
MEMKGEKMKRKRLHGGRLLVLLLTMILLPWQAQAFQFDVGNTDLSIRFDNTFKYSAAYRLKEQSDTLLEDVNYDDGDRNFDKGLVSNRIDWLGELEANLPLGGIRVSGAGWYDLIYNESNDNDSPFTSNSTSVAHDEFTEDTRDLHGRDVELLDAFAYLNLDPGPTYITLRAGRHSLVYGETFFFGSNGIAEAQGPSDLIKALTVPSSQFKELLRPVEQVSGSIQLTPTLTVGGYYQFKWHESRTPAAGSYLSSIDFSGEGAETLIGAFGPMERIDDLEPDDQGQGGVQLRYTLDSVGIDLGLYAAIYHAKTPSGVYVDPFPAIPPFPGIPPGTLSYRWVYAQDIETYGVSATGSWGQLNWATELAYRRNAPLNSDPQVDVGMTGGNEEDDRLYAVGETAHVNLSGIYELQANPLCDGGRVIAELAYNSQLEVTENEDAVAKNTTKEAYAFRMFVEPTYFQVLAGLDLSVPMSVGYNFKGRSSAIAFFNGGSSNAGDLSVGLGFTYRSVWKAGLSYVKYFGDEGTFTVPANSATPHLSFDQSLADRDFISFYISRAF